MSDISFDGIVYQPSLFAVPRHEDEFKGGGNALTAIAGVAVSIAVPFLAPTVAGAIFGGTAMAGLGGAILAGGVGAAMGAAGAYLTGNDPLLGALTGGLGAGAIQGFGLANLGAVTGGAGNFTGAFGAPVSDAGLLNFGQLFPAAGGAGAGTTAAAAVANPAAGTAILGGPVAGAAMPAAGPVLGAAAAPAAAAPGFMGLGAAQTQALTNAAVMATPNLVGYLGSELLPPSDQALATEQAYTDAYNQQQELYNTAMNTAQNISPELMAQNLAGQAQLQMAQKIAEGDSVGVQGQYDPARAEANLRRDLVAGSTMRGTGYMQGMLAGTEAQADAVTKAAGLQPNYAGYLEALSKFGVDAERKKRAADIAGFAEPFAGAFVGAKSDTQVKNA